MPQPIFIITGKVGSGKSTLLGELTEILQEHGISMDGFLCRGELNQGERSGYTMVNIRDGSEIIFATIDSQKGWPFYGRFCFNPEAITEGEKIIRKAIDRKSRLLIIDEVGPLELEGRGWSKMIDLVPEDSGLVQIWVVRESILAHFILQVNGRSTLADNEADNSAVFLGHEKELGHPARQWFLFVMLVLSLQIVEERLDLRQILLFTLSYLN